MQNEESTNTACTLFEKFLIRYQSFISERYTTPNVLYNFELISAVFDSVKLLHVIKITSVLFSRIVLNNDYESKFILFITGKHFDDLA